MKIAVIGVYGSGPDFTTGQAVKCLEVSNYLTNKVGEDQVLLVNTYRWKKKPHKLFWNVIKAFVKCDYILMLPAQHGLKVFAPMAYYLKKIFRKEVHYIVIGGWLPSVLEVNKRMKKYIASFDGVYLETRTMVERMDDLGLTRNYYMPNCRSLPQTMKENGWYRKTYNLCTYSRVTYDKGILDAIRIVQIANQKIGYDAFHLDIYGKIESQFEEKLFPVIEENPSVKYCGVKDAGEGVDVLSSYFALLFPTFYKGEGFAGTILDAFAAKTPVIANDWKYNKEIIQSGKNGFIYPYRDVEKAAEYLLELVSKPELYEKIQNACQENAVIYSVDSVMNQFFENMIEDRCTNERK